MGCRQHPTPEIEKMLMKFKSYFTTKWYFNSADLSISSHLVYLNFETTTAIYKIFFHRLKLENNASRTKLWPPAYEPVSPSSSKPWDFKFSFPLQVLSVPSVVLEPRFRGSIRNLRYADSSSDKPKNQEMMAFTVREQQRIFFHLTILFYSGHLPLSQKNLKFVVHLQSRAETYTWLKDPHISWTNLKLKGWMTNGWTLRFHANGSIDREMSSRKGSWIYFHFNVNLVSDKSIQFFMTWHLRKEKCLQLWNSIELV